MQAMFLSAGTRCLLVRRRAPHSLLRFCIARVSSSSSSACMASMKQPKHADGAQKTSVTDASNEQSVLEKVFVNRPQYATDTAGKVKQAATNVSLYIVFIVSVIVCCSMCYFMYEQIFAPGSAQKVFSKALKMVRNNDECEMLLGTPIRGFGEETGRGRRRNLAQHAYAKDGNQRIRVMFNVRGPKRDGVATAEMENADGAWNWRFVLVQTSEMSPRTVVVVDNR